MHVMYVLVGFSLLVALIFLAVFIWAVKSGQYEDKFTPSVRMLFDEDEKSAKRGRTAGGPGTDGTVSQDAATRNTQTNAKEPDIQEHRSKD